MASGDQSKQRKLEILDKLANHRSDISAKKQVLAEQITESKDLLTDQIKDKVNVPKIVGSKVKSSFSNSPNKWFLGSVVGGLIVSKLIFRGSKSRNNVKTSVADTAVSAGISGIGSIFRSPKKRRQTHGIFYTLVGYAARPMLKSFVLGKVRSYVANKVVQQAQQPREVYYEEYDDGRQL